MRAIAIAAVVVFHAFPGILPGGFLGVDVFFVISGYLITTVIRSGIAAGTFRAGDFYARRLRRIVPALVPVLLAALAAGWFLLLPLEYRRLGINTIGGALFFANVQFVLQSVYFDASAITKPLLHLWSLSVEEQFYIVWPFIVLFASRRKINALRLIAGLAAASFAADLFVTSAYSPDAAFYLPFTRFWEIMLGAIVAVAPFRSTRAAPVIAPVCLAAIVVSLAWGIALRADGSAPPWWSLVPAIATAVLIASGGDTWVARTLLSPQPMVWLGKISYPLYLWHWPLLSFLAIAAFGVPPPGIRIAAVGAACVLAWLTYAFVERPIRFGPNRERWVPRLAGALLGLAALGWVNVSFAGFPQRFPEPIRDYVGVGVSDDYKAETRANTCSLPELFPPDAYAPQCYRPSGSGKRSVLVWGDSFAARLYVGIAAAFGGSADVRQLTRDQCVPLLGQSDFPTCNAANEFVLASMARYRPDVVVMFAMWPLYGPYERGSARAAALQATIARVRASGVRHVVLVGPSPLWKAYLPSLLARRWRAARNAPIPAVMNDGLPPAIFAEDKQLRALASNAGIAYVSLTARLCSPAGCRTLTPGRPPQLMTADVGHFTKAGALYVVPFLGLRQLLEPN